MANGFGQVGRRRAAPKAPTFGGRKKDPSDAVGLLLLRDLMKQQAEARKPGQVAAQTRAREETQRQVSMGPEREILLGNMSRMKQLADQVPAGEAGVSRFTTGLRAGFGGFMQTLPQLNTYNRFKKVVLGSVVRTIGGETGSRLSDQDIKRMEGAFPSLPFDSADQRTLSWTVFFDTVNDVAQKYGAQPVEFDQFLTLEEVQRAKKIPGTPFYNSEIADYGNERRLAVAAIQAGKDSKRIRELFRQRTGQELDV